MMNRKELITSREFWVAQIHLNLWNLNGSIEKDSDKWEQMAEKIVDERFYKLITETKNFMLPEFENKLEEEACLVSESVADVVIISKLNDEETARKLIREQFIVINRQDI